MRVATPNAAFWDRLLGPHPRLTLPAERRGARLLAILMLVHVVLGAAMLLVTAAAVWRLVGKSIWGDLDTWLVTASLAAIAVLFAVMRLGYYRTAAVLYITTVTLVPLVCPFLPDPDANMGLLALAIIPVLLAAMVASYRLTTLLLAIIIAAAAALLALNLDCGALDVGADGELREGDLGGGARGEVEGRRGSPGRLAERRRAYYHLPRRRRLVADLHPQVEPAVTTAVPGHDDRSPSPPGP